MSTGCGHSASAVTQNESSKQTASSGTESDVVTQNETVEQATFADTESDVATQNEAAQQTASTDTESDADSLSISEWNIPLPDSTWEKEYSQFSESWELYKETGYNGSNSTISIYMNDMNAEASRLASENLTVSMGIGSVTKEFDYELNGTVCPAYEQYSEKYETTMVKAFYPLSSQKCLQFNLFVKEGSLQIIDPYSDEVTQLLQSIIDENGLSSASSVQDEAHDSLEQTIAVDDDGLSFEGQLYDDEFFSVMVPEGWKAFKSSYGSLYLIKNGSSQDDYGSKPSAVIEYNDEDAYTSYLTNKAFYSETEDLNVSVCGTECYAISYKEEMSSKPVYWTHAKVFMPISETANISIDIITDSSEFDGTPLLDDDVREIMASLQRK